jgi:hypothetical protein
LRAPKAPSVSSTNRDRFGRVVVAERATGVQLRAGSAQGREPR